MKKAKILSLVLALALCVAMLAGCSQTPAGSSSGAAGASSSGSGASAGAGEGENTFTDMTGREVSIEGPVESVVVVTAADCEIIYALGMGDAVVGRGEYCNYPEEVLEVEAVESGAAMNIEQIIALDPDVVFMGTMNQTTDQIEQLEKAGIPLVVSNAVDIAGTYRSIEVIGTALGKTEEAETLVANMKDGFAEIQQGAEEIRQSLGEEGEGKTVYFEVSPLEFGLWTAGSGTFMDEIATMLGLENAFSDVTDWAEISEEQVLERDPDYIVTVTMYFGEGPTPEEEIKSRPGWQELKAVSENRVFMADNDSITRPGPRLVEAMESLYHQIYS